MLDSADSRWYAEPDHAHARIEAGTKGTFEFSVRRPAGAADAYMRTIEAVVDADVLMPGHRYSLPTRRTLVPVSLEGMPAPEIPTSNVSLAFDGDDAVRIPSASVPLPDGPFTLEVWFNAEAYGQRTGLVCKTESADYGIFVNAARPQFGVFLDKAYVNARATGPVLRTGTWHHLAGVFDGAEVRLYVDGVKSAAAPGSGVRRQKSIPLMLGADVTGAGEATSHFKGRIDAVRLSKGAIYTGDKFQPERRLTADANTVLLTNTDAMMAGGLWLEKPRTVVGELIGLPHLARRLTNRADPKTGWHACSSEQACCLKQTAKSTPQRPNNLSRAVTSNPPPASNRVGGVMGLMGE